MHSQAELLTSASVSLHKPLEPPQGRKVPKMCIRSTEACCAVDINDIFTVSVVVIGYGTVLTDGGM